MFGLFSAFLAKVAPGSQLSQTFFPPATKFLPERDMPKLDGKIGYETCLALLKHGGSVKVYLGSRSAAKGQEAVDKLLAAVPGADVRLVEIDLADLRSVRRAAEEFLTKEDKLDILFNNGGVMIPPTDLITAQGWDGQFGTNCLGHYFFTKLLMPALTRAAPSRVINTSSSGWMFAPPGEGIDWDVLKAGPARDAAIEKWGKGTNDFGAAPWKFYGMSKLGNILVSNLLAREHSDVLVSCALHPGGMKTELQRHTPSWQQTMADYVLHPAYKGAWTQLWAGTTAKPEDVNGKFLIPWARVWDMPEQAGRRETMDKLKEVLEGAVEGF
ncbi:short-chain dehydrogenase/reductase SDR family protein [Pseudohyphozyma bogoriensis]|nr:short-chain dehydrogenase/reductase SDR family protein [Pseudohyphozyma bogoriensis]